MTFNARPPGADQIEMSWSRALGARGTQQQWMRTLGVRGDHSCSTLYRES